jgi:multidrug resistance efflux pump
MIRRLLLLCLAAGLIAGGVALYRAFSRPRGIVLTGIVTTHEVNVSPLIQGRLAQLLVKEGDNVKSGQLVAVIDQQELRADRAFYSDSARGAAEQVQESEAALKFQEAQTRDQIRQAEAAVEATNAKLREAKANLDLARSNFDRTQELNKKGVYPAQSLDQAQSAYQAAGAEVDSMQKQVDVQLASVALARSSENQITMRLKQVEAGRRQLDAAGAQVKKAQVRLQYTEIRAPIDGVVSVLSARQGEVLGIGQPILTLINPDDLWIRADIEETYIDRIHPGDELRFRLPSGAERSGTVFYRGVDADFATQRDVSDIKRDIRTFEFRLRADNRDRSLWPGLTAYVSLPPDVLGVVH